MPKKVLLFTDLGIDDVFAILYTFFRKDIQLVGIVADYGNVSRENAIKNINYLKYISGRKEKWLSILMQTKFYKNQKGE